MNAGSDEIIVQRIYDLLDKIIKYFIAKDEGKLDKNDDENLKNNEIEIKKFGTIAIPIFLNKLAKLDGSSGLYAFSYQKGLNYLLVKVFNVQTIPFILDEIRKLPYESGHIVERWHNLYSCLKDVVQDQLSNRQAIDIVDYYDQIKMLKDSDNYWAKGTVAAFLGDFPDARGVPILYKLCHD